MDGIKLNIGSGTRVVPAFLNLDNSPSVWVAKFPRVRRLLYQSGWLKGAQGSADWSGVTWKDVTRGLPFADDSVEKIYSSHFLEHIPEKKGKHVVGECFRVLRPGGRMRLVVPDLLFHAERYVEKTRALLAQKKLTMDRSAHDEFLDTVAGNYFRKGRKGAHHCYMYDLPTLVNLLREAGFQAIEHCAYREGSDSELYELDSRPLESLHLEVEKLESF